MSLRHAILALLDVEPGTGYDLNARFKRSVGFFWAASHQQVYKELHGLLDAGLVDCEEEAQSGRPARKVYSLTTTGETALDDWLDDHVPAMKIRDPLLVKVFAGRRLSPKKLAEELARHRAQHEKTLATYCELDTMIESLSPRRRARYLYPRQTLRMGIHYEQAWLTWCDACVRELGL